MTHIREELIHNNSTSEVFQFSLCCPECGGIWKSKKIYFSKAGVVPKTEGKAVIFDALYKREFENAKKAAIKEAEQNFSLCPICHRLVCDRCFMVCEDLDICVRCARQLKEHGEFVSEGKEIR